MKRIWKVLGALFALMAATAFIVRKTFHTTPALMTPAPAPSFRDHWSTVKETFGFDTARDMDSPSNIKERREDIS